MTEDLIRYGRGSDLVRDGDGDSMVSEALRL